MSSNELDAIEPWIAGYLAKLEPGERVRVARKIGANLRKSNAARIGQNIEPDGAPMEPRKPKKERKGRLRKRRGKMFPRTRLIRNMRVRPDQDGVTVDFRQPVAGTAAVHHFGLVDKVDRRIPNSISVRYPRRRLLGFSPEDRELIMDTVVEWIGK